MDTAIIFFIYNRPNHTKEVLDGLKKNKIKKIFVFGDGPRSEEDLEQVIATRNEIDAIDWCEVVKVYEQENKGLATSVIHGVSKVFDMGFERVIVLEDDCVPTKDFVTYMNKAFNFYDNFEKVMHISGFGLPLRQRIDKSTYFTPYPCSWGWGTWKKYWKACNFEDNERYIELLNDKEKLKQFNYAGSAFSDFLQRQLDGKVNSWLIRWYFHIYINQGVCVWKTNSCIKNLGFDGTGEHKVKLDRFNQLGRMQSLPSTFEDQVDLSPKIIKEFKRYFINKKFSERLKTVVYMYTGIVIG